MKLDLTGKVALVTGGNRGIGKSIALRLAENNANVIITGRNPKKLDVTLAELKKYNSECYAYQCDVREFDEQKKVFNEIITNFGKLDISVPNAGVATLASATQTTLEDWHKDIETNLTGTFITATESLKIMKKQNSGYVFAIVSKAGKKAFFLRNSYCSSKWGAMGFMKSFALEAKNYNVKATAICPASVATDFQKNNPAGMDWMMSPDTVADTIMFLLSLEKNAYIEEIVISTWIKDKK